MEGTNHKHKDGWTSDETFRSMRRNAEQYKRICKENEQLKDELEFYRSIFREKSNSAVCNLRIKILNGEKVWVDKVRDLIDNDFIRSLDRDEEVEEWLKPIRCER
tara:strand:- start:86 stop:400 length:315 start_codon:yes stop_codon:yes gene_type:complete